MVYSLFGLPDYVLLNLLSNFVDTIELIKQERRIDMPDDIQRILGQLQAGMESLANNQQLFRAEQRSENQQIFDKINDLAVNGCAVGRQHTADLVDLKARPERYVGIGAAAASIIGMLGTAIMWLLGRHQ